MRFNTRELLIIALVLIFSQISQGCQQDCYSQSQNENCPANKFGQSSYTLHMSVHPHLDAYWIFDFESYYNPQSGQYDVQSYFNQNRFSSVKQIFDTATSVLL
jgi:hypothetical protein